MRKKRERKDRDWQRLSSAVCCVKVLNTMRRGGEGRGGKKKVSTLIIKLGVVNTGDHWLEHWNTGTLEHRNTAPSNPQGWFDSRGWVCLPLSPPPVCSQKYVEGPDVQMSRCPDVPMSRWLTITTLTSGPGGFIERLKAVHVEKGQKMWAIPYTLIS